MPTLVFVLWAYGMYALISALSGGKGSRFRGRSSWRKYGGLALAAGAAAGVGLVLVMARSYEGESHRLKLAGFLGTVWAEGWPDRMKPSIEAFPVKSTASGNQPGYALLHPGTSLAGQAQAKAASKPRAHKPKLQKLQKVEVSQAREAKVTARPRK